jgi:chromosome segregation ATPase
MTFDPGAYISGLGGIISGVGLLVVVLRNYQTQVKELRRDMDSLKDERVAGIEARISSFESGCQMKHDRLASALNKVEHMAANLDNMVGWTKKLDAKLDRLGEDAASARATVAGQDKWLGNLDAAHQAHVRDRELHHG